MKNPHIIVNKQGMCLCGVYGGGKQPILCDDLIAAAHRLRNDAFYHGSTGQRGRDIEIVTLVLLSNIKDQP